MEAHLTYQSGIQQCADAYPGIFIPRLTNLKEYNNEITIQGALGVR
jgi:hypothetical protein